MTNWSAPVGPEQCLARAREAGRAAARRPRPGEDSVGAAMRGQLDFLARLGMVHAPPTPEREAELAARELAELSKSPRYAEDDWRLLLGSEPNVLHAAGKALADVELFAGPDLRERVARAVETLTSYASHRGE